MMRAAPLRYGVIVGLVAAPHSALMTRLRVPASLMCAGVAQRTAYQRRFASTANDTTQLTKTKLMLATKESGPDPSKELETLKSTIQAEAKKRGAPNWVLAMAQSLAKHKDPVTKTAGENPKVVTFDDYSARLDASILGDFSFVPQLQSSPAGLSSLADAIEIRVDIVRRMLKIHPVKGYTAAMVIKNTSGVGKTFGSVAVAGILNRKANEDQKADYYLPLYIGMGDVFPITQVEIDLLRDQQTYNEFRVRAVIGRRLLLQLMFISDKLANGKLKLWDVVESEEHRGFHLTPVPPESTFSSHMEFPLFDDKAMARCAELIQQLSEYCDGRKLVVLLIIDEGQKLDQFIEPQYDKEQGGAQLALLFGRELQLSCSENTKDAFLLTVMTGTNPSTYSIGNQGRNAFYRDPLNTLDEFVDIALALDQEREDADAQKRSRRITALFYPVARDVKSVYDAAKSKCFGKIFPEKPSLAPSTAQLFVMASGTESTFEYSKWDTFVPAIFSCGQYVPVPSFYHVSSNYLPHFKGLKLGKDTFGVSALTLRTLLDHHGFKSAAIDILNAILALTNMPGEPDESDAAHYQSMREHWLKRNKWFDLTLNADVSLKPMNLFKPTDSHQCYLSASPLHPGTRAQLGGLRQRGELFSMVCGDSAPVDFVFVMMKTSREKDTDPCEVELRLAEAKDTVTGNVNVNTMLENFSLVSNYLRAALKKECNMTVAVEKYAIVTNQRDAEQSMLVGCDSKLKDTVSKTHVLSPATLKFPPLTTRLFE